MVKIAVEDAESEHTGSTLVGPVAGTVTVGSNSFVTINGKKMVVSDGHLVIPSHIYAYAGDPPVPLFHSHNFALDSTGQTFVTVAGLPVALVGSAHSGDATEIKTEGSNVFVNI